MVINNLTVTFFLIVPFSLLGQDEIRMSIFFDGGDFTISDDQQERLVLWLDSIPNLLDKYHLEIISHTDPVGGRRFNLWLSAMRSNEVKNLLIRRYIPPDLIHIRDWSYDRPVYNNATNRGRVMNRRVDVIVRPMVF